MNTSLQWFAHVEPKLIRREGGGWLAMSPDEAAISIAVIAWQVDDARAAFAKAVRAWTTLLDEPSP
jgi:4-hydroxyphenylpyruvate dioxygenase-like putative hemolysin